MTKALHMTDWEREARAFSRRRLGAWIGTPVLTIAGMGLMVLGGNAGQWAIVALGVAMLAAALVLGSAIYMRVVDEQERDANLWGCYVGATVYLGLYVTRLLLTGLGITPPFSHDAIFCIFMLTVLCVFLWKRYR